MSPRPRTAEPSVTTATVLPLLVSVQTELGSSWMEALTRPTPGVQTMDISLRVLMGTQAAI